MVNQENQTGLTREVVEKDREEAIRKNAWFLALFGLFPFASLAVAAIGLGNQSGLHSTLIDLFEIYSIVILSFLGGVRWGLALVKTEASSRDLWFSILVVLPAVVAFSLRDTDNYMILCLLVAYCAMGAWDSISASQGRVPKWFGNLRITLTLLVALCHIIVFASLF